MLKLYILINICCDILTKGLLKMKKFEFSNSKEFQLSKFTGEAFYRVYQDAEFLRCSENVETILAKGYELRQRLKAIEPGMYIVVDKMIIERNTPLLVKNTAGPNVVVEEFEFTYNRLAGLTAAYAFENRHRFPIINSSEAIALGLVWDNEDEMKCQLYLSAVSGTEHFKQFSFYPLVCALRKLQLKKITLEPVLKIAKIKNDNGETMAKTLNKNYDHTVQLWSYFPGTSEKDMTTWLLTVPPALLKLFGSI
ncbi:hypothetical protein ACJJTC_017230 [Scirpophaga incertulas]